MSQARRRTEDLVLEAEEPGSGNGLAVPVVTSAQPGGTGSLNRRTVAGRERRVVRALPAAVAAVVVALALTGCSLGTPGDAPRDAEGRPLAPPPPTPTTCITVTLGPAPTCAPIHNPPSRRYVEQAIGTLLPTRGYGSIEHVRCTDRIPPAAGGGFLDPDDESGGLGAATEFSHWTCVGQEPEGDYLHEDVLWTPYSGSLTLNAVTRDRSPALTVPQPNDPGLPNPHASEEPAQPTPAASTMSQHEAVAH